MTDRSHTHRKRSTAASKAVEPIGSLIDLRGVVKTYTSGAGTFPALRGVDLQIQSGAFVSIVGKSGSGKSTLINLITGIDRPTSGQVVVGGVEIQDLTEEQIAVWRGRSIGVIFQFFQLLPTLTAVENILLAMDYGQRFPMAERPDRAMALLESVGMEENAHRVPHAMSGGQQQCVAVARALANDPVLLAADEPTGNLDSRSSDMVMQLFEKLAEAGKTILMVTHDRELAGRTHRTIRLADGMIVDETVHR